MNHQAPQQTLAFYRVVYSIETVKEWLSRKNPEVDYFVFDSFFPATADPSRPMLLCCFTLNSQEGYLNPYTPDLLDAYPGEIVLIAGPVKLTGNLLSRDTMETLLSNADDNFLLFTPNLDPHQQVIYTVTPFQRTEAGDVLDSTSINTNPSPPATAMANVAVS
jgi:hypothetical protein